MNYNGTSHLSHGSNSIPINFIVARIDKTKWAQTKLVYGILQQREKLTFKK